MRLVVAALVVASSGCALVFQEHVVDGYRFESEPRCTTTRGWALLDGIQIAGDSLVAVAESTRDDQPPDVALVVLATVSAVIDVVSMVEGITWARECERVRAEYDERRRAEYDEQQRVMLRRRIETR